ncbi:MAG: phenylalanine--tRNA ligase subunit alpha [Planctomycetota bacterium]|jgi:phenylalanyl-tRNA synthetase alpha chain
MDAEAIIETLHPLEVKVLLAFRGKGVGESLEMFRIYHSSHITEAQCRRAVELLGARGLLEKTKEDVQLALELTDAGKRWAADGLPEVRVKRAIGAAGETTVNALQSTPGIEPAEIGPAVGALKKAGAIEIGEGGKLTLIGPEAEKFDALQATTADVSKAMSKEEVFLLDALDPTIRSMVEARARKRGKDRGAFRILEIKSRWYGLTDEGRALVEAMKEKGLTGDEITALTPSMLRDGSWRGRAFRRFNLGLAPPRIHGGRKHPYRAYLDWVKTKLLSLGFREITGSLVEPEFWNMDALFMPQFHASREIHDVYRIREPKAAPKPPSPHFDRVAETHTNGGDTGSRGWGYIFDEGQARRNVLRSQGTVLSVRMLASKPAVPGKYFAMARCFRPDTVDATHAVDFFQVEGIVLGEDVNFRKLLGLLRLFALEIARSEELKFVPNYFPFTEPSVEVHMKHPRLGWCELGGAGIFRREVTDPMGVKVPVAAWGLGLDRMAMVALGIDDIRNLFSRDLNLLRETKVRL